MLRAALSSPSARQFLGSFTHVRSTRGTLALVHARSKHPFSSQAHTPNDVPAHLDSSRPLDLLKRHLKKWTETTSAAIWTRADDLASRTQSTFSRLASHMNKVTGYEYIEALRHQVVEQESRMDSARQAARVAKAAYRAAVLQRSNSQREVNDLLQRKSTWIDADVSRFTTLVRLDHSYEQQETSAKAGVDNTEASVEREFTELLRSILARYHEEQVWSDKIRSLSTYGSLAALGVNLVVFVMAILIVEPWKRRRLTQTFEKKVEEMSADHRAAVDKGMEKLRMQQLEILTTAIISKHHSEEAKVEDNGDRKMRVDMVISAVAACTLGWLVRSWVGA